MEVHVVSKTDNARHATFAIQTEPVKLAPSSIRVRTLLVSLTSNNLSYARGGDFLHWCVFPRSLASEGAVLPISTVSVSKTRLALHTERASYTELED